MMPKSEPNACASGKTYGTQYKVYTGPSRLRGRKPQCQSRSSELREQLIAWKQKPKFARSSLRTLARELGTSHQLLAFYLKGLEEWRATEYSRQAREIRARANAEGRPMTQWEEQQARSYDRAGISLMTGAFIVEDIRRIRQDSERRPLTWHEVKALKIYARSFPEARELLETRPHESPKKRKRFADIVRETPRREGESSLSWVRRIWDRCREYDTTCPAVLTEELLEKYSRRAPKSQREIICQS